MTVYLEYVIIDNFIMDLLLLGESAKLLKLKTKPLRLVFGALIGTLGAIITPLLKVSQANGFLLKIALGAIVCLSGVKCASFKEYFKYFNVFLLMTFITGGAIIGALELMGLDYTLDSYRAAGVLPVGVNLLIAYLFARLVKRFVKRFAGGIVTQKYVFSCHLKKGAVVISAKGYFDSGNKLTDDKTGLPVALCGQGLLDKMIANGASFSAPRPLTISTVTKGGEVLLYEVDNLAVETENGLHVTNLLLGVIKKPPFKEDLLLGAYIF